jgi:hypothetical protein
MPGARCTRSLACKSREHTSVVATGSPEQAQHFLRNGFNGFLRALVSAKSARMCERAVLVSAKSARMCERAVLTNRPSLDLSPFRA